MKLYRYGYSIEKLGQRYRLDGFLGNGGMADICQAWDEKDQREVAIKVIKSDGLDPETLNRFIREGSLIRGWQHPHIIQIYDDVHIELLNPSTGSTIPYLVMEYITGGTLQERLKADHPYPFSKTITIFGQLCDALQYAHEHHVIHRDLKPSNILFKSSPDAKDFIILSDFGLAVSTTATHHTFSRGGTPLYMAPEQFRGQTVQASDIFALGIILYRLCTGQMPFQFLDLHKTPLLIPTLPSSINTALPKALDQVILTALQEDPQQRHASAKLFWQQIQAAIRPTKEKTQSPTGAQPTVAPQLNQLPQPEKEIQLETPATPQVPQPSIQPIPQPEPAKQPSSHEETIEESSASSAAHSTDPGIIDLNPRKKPHTTVPLPPGPPHTPTSRRSRAIAAGAVGAAAAGAIAGVALGAATLTNTNQPASTTPATRTPPASPPFPPRAVPVIRGSKNPNRRSQLRLGLLLLLLTILLLCGSLAYLDHPVLSSVLGSSVQLPGIANATLVTMNIMPASQIVSNSYIITGVSGTPDPKQQTIKAHSLSGTAQSQILTAKASGHNQTVGSAATGTLTFFNINSTAMTIQAHTMFTASNGIQVWNNTTVTIPAAINFPAASSQGAAATVLSIGTNGNIGPATINGGCCAAGVSVKNITAFSGGIDPANYNFVTQNDINAIATQTVQDQVAQQANTQLKSKLAPGEQLAASPQCQAGTSSSAPIGDHHQNVESSNVTVSVTCNSVAYDDQGMRTLVAQLLTQKAQISPGTAYILQNNHLIIDPKVQSVNPVSLNVTAKGQWIYQLGDQQKNELFALAKGKSPSEATTALLGAKGVANATIQFSGTTLPTDISQYNFVFENPPPLPVEGTGGGGAGVSPTVTANAGPGTPASGVGR